MKSKCGLGVLILAALLSTIAIWFLPVNSAADIFMLITGGGVTHITTQTETYEIQTSLEETNAQNISNYLTDLEENNLTLPVVQTEYPVTSGNIFSTQSPESSWIIGNVTSDVQIDTRSVTGIHINNHTHFYPSLYFVDKRSVTPDITTDVMENDKAACNSGPNSAEVLAIVLGASFLTILLSALLYQFTVFIRNKKAHRNSSVFIIENELQKYDVEANGVEPETRL